MSAWPSMVYAIGDVHGSLAELRALTRAIVEDAAGIAGEKLIVVLGDLIDRGPDSAGVLDTLMAAPPTGFQRMALAGNHEVMFLDFMAQPRMDSTWLSFGGIETLMSYGIDPASLARLSQQRLRNMLESHIPADHLAYLRQLPISISLPGVILVHAGIRWGTPIAEQSSGDLLWIRDEFFNAAPQPGLLVVHGHTPGAEPFVAPHRICVDTGAFATGRLTCVCLDGNSAPRFLST